MIMHGLRTQKPQKKLRGNRMESMSQQAAEPHEILASYGNISVAMILQAAEDLKWTDKRRDDAVAWITHSGPYYATDFLSFANCCDALGWDEARVRQRLLDGAYVQLKRNRIETNISVLIKKRAKNVRYYARKQAGLVVAVSAD